MPASRDSSTRKPEVLDVPHLGGNLMVTPRQWLSHAVPFRIIWGWGIKIPERVLLSRSGWGLGTPSGPVLGAAY